MGDGGQRGHGRAWFLNANGESLYGSQANPQAGETPRPHGDCEQIDVRQLCVPLTQNAFDILD
jgi:hypothetical protein